MSKGSITYKGKDIHQMSQGELIVAMTDVFDTINDRSNGWNTNTVDNANKLSAFFQDDVSRACYGVWRQ